VGELVRSEGDLSCSRKTLIDEGLDMMGIWPLAWMMRLDWQYHFIEAAGLNELSLTHLSQVIPVFNFFIPRKVGALFNDQIVKKITPLTLYYPTP
jgi:hypothetical protein